MNEKDIDKYCEEMRMHQLYDEKAHAEETIDNANLGVIIDTIKEIWSEIDRADRAIIRHILKKTVLSQLENVRTTQKWLDNK